MIFSGSCLSYDMNMGQPLVSLSQSPETSAGIISFLNAAFVATNNKAPAFETIGGNSTELR